MAESEVVDTVHGSQNSQKTIEYSLEGIDGNRSLSGDTEDHPEEKNTNSAHAAEGNSVTLNPQEVGEDPTLQGGSAEHGDGTNELEKKADSPEGNSVLNPQQQMNAEESPTTQGGFVEHGKGAEEINDQPKGVEVGDQRQVSEGDKDKRGSQDDQSEADSNYHGRSEESALSEAVNKDKVECPTNQKGNNNPGSVNTKENAVPDTEDGNTKTEIKDPQEDSEEPMEQGEVRNNEPSSKSDETDVQDSQEVSEKQDGDDSEMEVDHDTGQASAMAKSEPKHTTKGTGDGTGQGGSSAKAGSKRKNAAKEMDDDDDSDDDSGYGYPWGRPWASRDTQAYRSGYQGKRDNPHLSKNYKFYTNQIPSEPDGDLIDTIHAEWKGNYYWLEIHHGYIQWLFPIREHGLNWHAQELQSHEIESICADPVAHKRILTSYELMLDFYGMKLKDPNTGELERAENWQSRFRHLNHSMHNYLRITRILKCLGEFGYERLKAPFVQFVLHEAIVERTLCNTMNSCMNYWLEVIKDDNERKQVRKYVKKLSEKKN